MAKAKKKKYSASDKAILGIGYVLLGAFVLSILVPLLYVAIQAGVIDLFFGLNLGNFCKPLKKFL